MKVGDVLVHKLSGTFSEVVYSSFGFSLSFSIKYGGRVSVSKTVGYAEDDILSQWRHADTEEVELFNRGKSSIN